MKAVKGNKVYTIESGQKKNYRDRGYDIQDDNGDVIEYGKGKTVPYEQYKKLENELEALKKAGCGSGDNSGEDNTAGTKGAAKDDLGEMSVEELKAYAETNEINIGNATSKEGILKKVREAAKEQE